MADLPETTSIHHEMTLAGAIRARRGELGMKQSDLADRSGVPLSTLGAIERGVRVPRAATLARLEEALGWEPGRAFAIVNAEPAPDISPEQARAALEAFIEYRSTASNGDRDVLTAQIVAACERASIDRLGAVLAVLRAS